MIIKVHQWNAGFQPAPHANRGLRSAGKMPAFHYKKTHWLRRQCDHG
jgi:hypothetical protein